MGLKTISIAPSGATKMDTVHRVNASIDINFQVHRNFGSKDIVALQGVGHWNHVLASWLSSPSNDDNTTQDALERAINLALVAHCARAATRWRLQGFNIDVWVELNTHALVDAKFSTDLLACIQQEQAEPDWLVLEIDEAALASAGEHGMRKLEGLAKLGFKIALSATGAPIFAFDKRLRALISHLKYDGASTISLKQGTLNTEARAFTRRMLAVQAIGIPVIVAGIGSKERMSDYRQIGFTRYQSGRYAKAMSFETASQRLNGQTIAARIRRPTLPQEPWNPDLSDQSMENVLIESLQQTQQSMLRLANLESFANSSIDTIKAA